MEKNNVKGRKEEYRTQNTGHRIKLVLIRVHLWLILLCLFMVVKSVLIGVNLCQRNFVPSW